MRAKGNDTGNKKGDKVMACKCNGVLLIDTASSSRQVGQERRGFDVVF